MAFRLNTTLKGYIEAPQCYAKIVEVQYTQPRDPGAPGGCITILVAFFFNQEARIASVNNYVEIRGYYHVCDNDDSRQALYEWLKTQTDFSGAFDIWEVEFTGDSNLTKSVSADLTSDANLVD